MDASYSRREVIALACKLIEKWTGFELRETAPQRIAETFEQRAQLLGYDTPISYLKGLRDLPSTAEEPQRLVNLITNGLTAFWRDEPQLSALRSVLCHLDAGPPAIHPIQVWCAGVSTGEEAYTVAMIADEEGIGVDVLGTDINTDFLATARRGVFDEWSLRRLSPNRRRTYLRPLEHSRWRAEHRAFENLRFAHHNLMDPAPSSRHPDGKWDIILCRNVLIYFSPTTTAKALRHMSDALTRDGYLMFGSSEQVDPQRLGPSAPDLRPIRKGGGFLYRPGSVQTGRTIEPGRWHFEDSQSLPPVETTRDLGSLEETTSDVRDNRTVIDLLYTAKDHLEKGDRELTIACLEAALVYDPFQVECHCLMGVVLRSLGASQQALESFQKALFLDPHHWFAAHHTASILAERDDIDGARRAYLRVLKSLERDEDPLESTHVLRDVIGTVSRIEHGARQQAENFLQTHRER